MKYFLILCVGCFIFSCGTIIDRQTSYSFYVVNTLSEQATVIGICFDCDSNMAPDTLVAQNIPENNTLLIASEVYRKGSEGYYSIGVEKCDSLFIICNDIVIVRSWNPYKTTGGIEDSTTLFYQFANPAVWVPFETIEYDSDGPQPKEIKYKFSIE